jgi:hypothetical protein
MSVSCSGSVIASEYAVALRTFGELQHLPAKATPGAIMFSRVCHPAWPPSDQKACLWKEVSA